MGKTAKLHSVGRERKQKSFSSVVDKGCDGDLEEECRALQAEDELHDYYVDRCFAERAAAAEARAAARRAAAAAATLQDPPAPPAEEALAAPAPAAPAEDPAPPAEAPAEENPAAAN